MKFGKQLERHKIRGWDAFYVDYNGLKRSLKGYPKSGKNLSASVSTAGGRLERDVSSSDGASPRDAVKVSQEWVAELQASIDRTNEFFTSVADEVESRLVAGHDELEQNKGSDFELQLRRHLQSMIGQLQATLQDLTHFSAANHTALYKILKKHDKQTGLALSKQLLPQILGETFNEPGKVRLEELQRRLERFGGELGVENSPWALDRGENTLAQVARISFFLGVISMALVVLAVLSGMEPQIDQFSVEDLAATIPVLRLSFMMNLTAWLAGACAWVFEHYKINYLFLLDISPDLEVSAMSLLNYASLQTGVWIVLSFCFIADMKFGAVLQSIPCIHGFSLAHIYSSSVLIMQFLITSSWMTASTRRLFSRLFIRILCFSCLGEVSFAENVLADVLTSLGRPLKDVAYTGCYFRHWHTDQDREVRRICKNSAWTGCTVQILLLLPLFFRIAQCYRRMRDTPEKFRHGLNCGKYVFAVLVSLLTSVGKPPRGLTSFQLSVIQTLGYFLATVYAATWDLVVDFGLLGFKSRRCLFPRFSYIAVAILDVYLRSTWLLTYQPDCRAYVGASTFNKECFAFLISSLELIRRGLWATIRIEHEHQSNAGRFRSVCWVPPLDHRRPSFNGKTSKRKPLIVALVNSDDGPMLPLGKPPLTTDACRPQSPTLAEQMQCGLSHPLSGLRSASFNFDGRSHLLRRRSFDV